MMPEPVSAPVPEPVKPVNQDEKLYRSAFESMNDESLTRSRADRIRLIHDMLRNNPNGPDLVQSMSALESADGELYEGRHSSTRESSAYSMRADGTMVKNAYFGDQPD